MRVFPSLPLTCTSFSTKARHTLRRAFFYGRVILWEEGTRCVISKAVVLPSLGRRPFLRLVLLCDVSDRHAGFARGRAGRMR